MDKKRSLKVLIADDEEVVREFLCRFLKIYNAAGIEAKTAEDGEAALALARQEKFDLFFLDIRMPRVNGMEAFRELYKLQPESTYVFMTGYAAEEALLAKTKLADVICLRKPFGNLNQIKEVLDGVLRKTDSTDKQKQPKDRRAYIRFDAQLEVSYKKIKKGKDPLVMHSVSKNIAPYGMMLIAKEALEPKEMLELEIQSNAGPKICAAKAQVVWCKKDDEKTSDHYMIGIVFVDIQLAQLAEVLIYSGMINRPV